MQIRADNFQEILEFAVVAQTMRSAVELFPISCVKYQMIERRLIIDALIEPSEIAGHSQIVLCAAYDGHVIDGIPRSDSLSGDIVRGEMLVHVLDEPGLN